MYNQFWENVDIIMILRGVKVVPPLSVTEGHKFKLAKYSTLHGKCRIIFYYLKWVAKIYILIY